MDSNDFFNVVFVIFEAAQEVLDVFVLSQWELGERQNWRIELQGVHFELLGRRWFFIFGLALGFSSCFGFRSFLGGCGGWFSGLGSQLSWSAALGLWRRFWVNLWWAIGRGKVSLIAVLYSESVGKNGECRCTE